MGGGGCWLFLHLADKILPPFVFYSPGGQEKGGWLPTGLLGGGGIIIYRNRNIFAWNCYTIVRTFLFYEALTITKFNTNNSEPGQSKKKKKMSGCAII